MLAKKGGKEARVEISSVLFIPQGCFKTPSPSAYYKERVHPQGEKKAPTYSMGSRTKYRKSELNVKNPLFSTV